MSRSRMRSIAGCAVLTLTAASPSFAVTLGVVPAHPVEQTPFTLLIGGEASCPSLDTLQIQPNGVVIVRILLNLCPTLPQPFLLEVPIPPLQQGKWVFQVLSNGQPSEGLTVNVEPQPFRLDVDPPTPRAGSPFIVHVTGSGICPALSPKPVQDGNLLTLVLFEDCDSPFVPPPESFVIDYGMEPLAAGNYVMQVTDSTAKPLASRRFRVSDSAACLPSDTALCLLQGRYRVEARWRTAEGEGEARAHPGSANFGSFSLADPDRRELLVGLLDACASPTRTVWVSASGLTDAEVEITVTEVATGEVRHYDNPLGVRFAPVWDPMAFVCGSLGVGEEAAWHVL